MGRIPIPLKPEKDLQRFQRTKELRALPPAEILIGVSNKEQRTMVTAFISLHRVENRTYYPDPDFSWLQRSYEISSEEDH